MTPISGTVRRTISSFYTTYTHNAHTTKHTRNTWTI